MTLNYDYTLENYLIGNNNISVKEAMIYAISRPGHIYNPLFICGPTGAGKTHLLQAFTHDAIKSKPYLNIRYATSEEFVGDAIEAMQNHNYKDFVRSCMRLDILLIDDIYLFKGKKYTLRELLYIFKCLYKAKKQIIISGDKSLKGIFRSGSSMFKLGSIVEIHPPTRDDCLKFLRRKAEKVGMPINDNIFEQIADKATLMDFRELEGALAKEKLLGVRASLL